VRTEPAESVSAWGGSPSTRCSSTPLSRRITLTVGQSIVSAASPIAGLRLRSSRTRSRHGAPLLEHSTCAANVVPALVLAACTRISELGITPFAGAHASARPSSKIMPSTPYTTLALRLPHS
jgi:hypothetical protein